MRPASKKRRDIIASEFERVAAILRVPTVDAVAAGTAVIDEAWLGAIGQLVAAAEDVAQGDLDGLALATFGIDEQHERAVAVYTPDEGETLRMLHDSLRELRHALPVVPQRDAVEISLGPERVPGGVAWKTD